MTCVTKNPYNYTRNSWNIWILLCNICICAMWLLSHLMTPNKNAKASISVWCILHSNQNCLHELLCLSHYKSENIIFRFFRAYSAENILVLQNVYNQILESYSVEHILKVRNTRMNTGLNQTDYLKKKKKSDSSYFAQYIKRTFICIYFRCKAITRWCNSDDVIVR